MTASYLVSYCISTKAITSCVTGKWVENLVYQTSRNPCLQSDFCIAMWQSKTFFSRSWLFSREVIFIKHIDNLSFFYITKLAQILAQNFSTKLVHILALKTQIKVLNQREKMLVSDKYFCSGLYCFAYSISVGNP